jgi:hypothetical protein
MELSQLVTNGQTLDVNIENDTYKVENANIRYQRIDYTGFNIEIDGSIVFYCGAAKNAVDAEYDANFIEGTGTAKLYELCGSEKYFFDFILDYKTYEKNEDFTKIGLRYKSPLDEYLNNDTNNVEIPNDLEKDVWLKKLKLGYDFKMVDIEIDETPDQQLEVANNSVFFQTNTGGIGSSDYNTFGIWVYPNGTAVDASIIESNNLTQNFMLASKDTGTIPVNGTDPFFGGTYSLDIPQIASQEIITNEVGSDLQLDIDFTKVPTILNINSANQNTYANPCLLSYSYHISIGPSYDKPRKLYRYKQYFTPYTVQINQGANAIPIPTSTALNLTETLKKNEKVYIFYYLEFHGYANSTFSFIGIPPIPRWFNEKTDSLKVNSLKFDTGTELNIKSLSNYSVVDPNAPADIDTDNSFLRKAFFGSDIYPLIFKITKDEYSNGCTSDLHFIDGQRLRNKTDKTEYKVKPKDFFNNLTKIMPCGIGLDYTTGEDSVLADFDYFYDNTFYKTFDALETITIKSGQNYYNEIDVGYADFYENKKEIFLKTLYNIKNIIKKRMELISDFIASSYLIMDQVVKNSELTDNENDFKTYLLSIKEGGGKSFAYYSSFPNNFTFDGVSYTLDNESIEFYNKRYATIYNLNRNVIKFRKSYFKVNELDTLRNYQGIVSASSNTGSPCYLISGDAPTAKVTPKSILRITDIEPIEADAKVNMSISEFIELRKNWHKKISVQNDGILFTGHIVSADFLDNIVSLKLIKR